MTGWRRPSSDDWYRRNRRRWALANIAALVLLLLAVMFFFGQCERKLAEPAIRPAGSRAIGAGACPVA